MSRGYLSGDEPEEIEEKTEAQLNEERQASFLAASDEMFAAAETDDTPAIERTNIHHDSTIIESHDSRPSFKIDQEFESEMKAREATEKKERDKRRQEAEKKERKQQTEHQQKIQEKLQESKSLDPDEIREQLKDETYRENLDKIYPDAKPLHDDVDEAIWQERRNKGENIDKPAKLESVYDTELQKHIYMTIPFEIVGVVFGVIAFLSSGILSTLSYIVTAITVVISVKLLFISAKHSKHHEVPSDQHRQFAYATVIPGMVIRLLLIAALSMLPLTGRYVCAVAGAAIGASIHYTFLNNFRIYVSLRDTIINTVVFAIIFTFYELSSGDSLALIWIIVGVIEFFFGDRFAMLVAYRTNK